MEDYNHAYINNTLPHNFLAEKIILSNLLTNLEAIEITLETLPIEAFYFQNHQEIYRAISYMYKNKIPIDLITLTSFLQDNGLLPEIGGIKVVMELFDQVPSLIYLEEYIALVNDKFIRRSLIEVGYEIINSSYIMNASLEDVLVDSENKIFNLTNEIKTEKLSSGAEILTNVFLELKDKSLNPELSGLESGFYDLDSLTQGFQKSDLIIIAGRPGMGKTALGLNITLNILKNGKLPVMFFSLEMSKEQIMYRLLAMETQINLTKFRNGKLYQNDWIKINRIIKILSRLPLFVDDSFNLSIENIRSKIKNVLFEQEKIGLIIIDYLQLMQNSKIETENRVQELSKITRSLKTIAREFNLPIIALSQLSRNVENRIDNKPILSDLRGSGSIEQDADLVLLLHQNTSYNLNQPENDKMIELILAKHRNGPTGTIKLRFDQCQTRFFNLLKINNE